MPTDYLALADELNVNYVYVPSSDARRAATAIRELVAENQQLGNQVESLSAGFAGATNDYRKAEQRVKETQDALRESQSKIAQLTEALREIRDSDAAAHEPSGDCRCAECDGVCIEWGVPCCERCKKRTMSDLTSPIGFLVWYCAPTCTSLLDGKCDCRRQHR